MPRCVFRLANARSDFQEAVNKLVVGDHEDGLEDELQEAAETVHSILDNKLSEDPEATGTAAIGVSSLSQTRS